jgi:DNA gyrase/topoisomerase IV subunit A
LQKLTGLEQEKIINEYEEILEQIADLLEILSEPGSPDAGDSRRTEAIKEQFGDERRSEIVVNQIDLTLEDLITEEDVVVTLSHTRVCEIPADRCLPGTAPRWARARRRPRPRTRISSTLSGSPTRTTPCCASPVAARSTGLKVYELPQAGHGVRAGDRWSTCCRSRKASASTPSCRRASSATTGSCSSPPARAASRRTSVNEISRLGRNTQGVTLIRLAKGEQVIGMARIEASEEEEGEGDALDSEED